MKPPILIIIMATIMTGTMIVMLSSHWLLIWIGFEMNMLAVIPVLMKKYNPRTMEASTKYFLTQATASMLLMMGVTINLLYSGQWVVSKISNPVASIMMTIALTMKLGLSPFHFWVPEVTQGITLTSGMILLTWRKIAPMSVLYQISPSINTNLLMLVALVSVLVGGWGGLNQTQLRKIMAYSSIAHMGWMTAIIIYNPTMMILNLVLLHSNNTINLHIIYTKLIYHNLIFISHVKFPLITSIILILMLSLGGLPPLSGFIPKLMFIQGLTKNNMIIIPPLMAITALLNQYFYLRLTYSTALTMFPSANNMKMKWQFEHTKKTILLPPLIITSTMLLPLTPMLSVLD
uniref:NADH-ubiquinone oxidoreductase chain 2 n=1 Tax=Cuon alpinus lepturus TaxID=1419108 RepID=U6A6Q4_CUOAL|nr:NADH dehydrogenase subunit 2 [Cuon alpinus lepturus]